MTVTVAAVQPNFMPWLGYFDMIRKVDQFVFYDDVQFVRKGWANRNAVRHPANRGEWLTIPTLHGAGKQGHSQKMLNALPLTTHADVWPVTIPNRLRAWYMKSKHLHLVEELSEILHMNYSSLADLNIAIIEWMMEKLDIDTPTLRMSGMGIPLELDKTERPLALCQQLGATRFLSGPTAKDYIDVETFTRAGVEIEWHSFAEHHPVYQQHREPFIPFLSAIDYLLETGEGWTFG